MLIDARGGGEGGDWLGSVWVSIRFSSKVCSSPNQESILSIKYCIVAELREGKGGKGTPYALEEETWPRYSIHPCHWRELARVVFPPL